ncbi:hypothetical protein GCM10017559_33670 [Streptosporangium longisporum]|uniref:Secreted protein n=1 Tax=Streptosporangium longisporum TaxID=46187 RepID=A0ABN3XYS2_9ACTN
MKRRSTILLLIMASVAVPTLSTAAPLDCRMRPLTKAESLAMDESFLERQREDCEKERHPDRLVHALDDG